MTDPSVTNTVMLLPLLVPSGVFGFNLRTGFDVNFPAIAKDPVVAAAVGYTGRNFLADSVDITRWYNRATETITGSVIFSSGCEGPPGEFIVCLLLG